jgi:signal transduction histidine kinase
LDDFGLLPAMRAACQDFRERTGLMVELQAEQIEQRLPALLELSLYRILQEALMNIEKHSRASKVSVQFNRDGSYVTLDISDDGQGVLQQNGGHGRGGLGLLLMRERANLVGGVFSMRAAPGQGVRLTIHAPVNESLQIERE